MSSVSPAGRIDPGVPGIGRDPSYGPSVHVYTGLGSSHSWIWSAQCLDRLGLLRTRFVDSASLLRSRPDVLILSGGDAFRMAEQLGRGGLDRIREWVSEGGMYVGICAGAYLGLISRTSPLPTLGLVHAPIANLSMAPPRNLAFPEKYLVACGERQVYHPLRGEVVLDTNEGIVSAPLFGGPIWNAAIDGEFLARYKGWSKQTTLMVDEVIAREVLVSKGAILIARHGEGQVWLMGPHLEHPDYPEANDYFATILRRARTGALMPFDRRVGVEQATAVRRLLSEARVAYRGLEGASWIIGRKVWDHEKIGYFVGAMWERVQAPEREGLRLLLPETMEMELAGIVRTIRGIRRDMALGSDTSAEAERLFEALSSCASSFFNAYFDWRLRASLAAQRWG